VTGIRTKLEDRVQDLIIELQGVTDKPIGVGFGISQPDQARQVMEWGADAAIVGSAFVKRLAEGQPAQGLESLSSFCRSLKTALKSEA
jgi:tryptophan synthase alpha chain